MRREHPLCAMNCSSDYTEVPKKEQFSGSLEKNFEHGPGPGNIKAEDTI